MEFRYGEGKERALSRLGKEMKKGTAYTNLSDKALNSSTQPTRTAKIWDAWSGACLAAPGGHGGSDNSAAFSHDSVRLASALNDGIVKIWDTSLTTLGDHGSSVNSVAFSHDSTQLVSASGDG